MKKTHFDIFGVVTDESGCHRPFTITGVDFACEYEENIRTAHFYILNITDYLLSKARFDRTDEKPYYKSKLTLEGEDKKSIDVYVCRVSDSEDENFVGTPLALEHLSELDREKIIYNFGSARYTIFSADFLEGLYK